MKIEIRDCKSDKLTHSFNDVISECTVIQLKKMIHSQDSALYPARQSLRTSPTGKSLNDDRRLLDLLESDQSEKLCLYLRDLGPQIGWRTVFLVEYTGPLVIYLTMWLLRQPEFRNPLLSPITTHIGMRRLAMACYCGHYIKRLAETLFVHRFSHATMPLRNLFKNCTYYFGFTVFVSYFVNHPLYTLPAYGCVQICTGLAIFLLCEWGNFSCHVALKNLRPPGSTVRKVPKPVPGWPLTGLFNYVACPHYTYEVAAWCGFAIMTQVFPALLFAMVGFGQMSIWALARLRAYRREFPEYPRNRKAIVPFIL